ncbi:hypothetical protein [Streptomyces sp. ZSW22]|uniref:hypothetical protein n=1 Tax=Streptomyces TaxID=1883 RepID=UPI00339D6C3A
MTPIIADAGSGVERFLRAGWSGQSPHGRCPAAPPARDEEVAAAAPARAAAEEPVGVGAFLAAQVVERGCRATDGDPEEQCVT